MAYMRHIGIVLLFILTVCLANGQADTTEKTKIEFKISANYNTGLNYYGRIDSLHSSGFFPLAELWFNEKFYINAAPVFVNIPQLHFNMQAQWLQQDINSTPIIKYLEIFMSSNLFT